MKKILRIINNEVVAYECNNSESKCIEVARYSGFIDIKNIMSWKKSTLEIQKKRVQKSLQTKEGQ